MAKIKIISECPLYDGMSVTFQAPCDCTAVDGLNVYYDGVAQTFGFRDAHGNDLAGTGNLFAQGSYVKAILNTATGCAYLQNADTNKYIEGRFATIDVSGPINAHNSDTSAHSDIRAAVNARMATDFSNASAVLGVAKGGTGATSLDALATALGCVKYATGTYVGTNTYGSGSPNKVTFPFEPKVVFVNEIDGAYDKKFWSLAWFYGATTGSCITRHTSSAAANRSVVLTWSGNTLSWHTSESYAVMQGNASGVTYRWVAFG